VREVGLIGDRAYALIDNSTGKIASAKNPRKWARLFDCHASFVNPHAKIVLSPPVWNHAAGWQQRNERSAQRECGSFTLVRARGDSGQNGFLIPRRLRNTGQTSTALLTGKQ